uniref:Uncharacterized protein n=1 Tax=uncultured prokaryote TaxID=198431 RepID=A0A0H5PXV4_9ZZZZ|nr:hypothetical protein [uncultured prokaryote]
MVRWCVGGWRGAPAYKAIRQAHPPGKVGKKSRAAPLDNMGLPWYSEGTKSVAAATYGEHPYKGFS